MTKFEVLTLLIALLALVPAVLALIRQSAQRNPTLSHRISYGC